MSNKKSEEITTYTYQTKTNFNHLLECFEAPVTLFFALLFQFKYLLITVQQSNIMFTAG